MWESRKLWKPKKSHLNSWNNEKPIRIHMIIMKIIKFAKQKQYENHRNHENLIKWICDFRKT